MAEEIFTTVCLPTGTNAVVLEGKGKHYFQCLSRSKGDMGMLMKCLVIELVRIDDKKLSESEVDEMHMRDVSYLNEVIGTMLSNDLI